MTTEDKRINRIINNIKTDDMKRLGFISPVFSDFWMLGPSAKLKARAKGGFKLGHLVHYARERDQMYLEPEDITGAPYRAAKHRSDCSTEIDFCGKLILPFPIFSANMECATDSEMAINLALMGGIGVIHQFQTPDEQRKEIETVKSISLNKSKKEIKKIIENNQKAIDQNLRRRINMSNNNRVIIDEREYEPAADKNNCLVVAGSTGIKNPDFSERIDAIIKGGTDMVVLDTAHGHSGSMIEAINEAKEVIMNLKDNYPNILVLAGNVITAKGAYELLEAGADGIKAGVGPGFNCITRKVTGFGIPMISGLYEISLVAKYFEKKHNRRVFVVADGGVSEPGTALKYFATGVQGIMIGTYLAQTSASPSYKTTFNKKKCTIKTYGSASDRAKQHQKRPLWDTPEGIEREVPFIGSTILEIARLITGCQSGLSYSGTNPEGYTDFATHARYSRWVKVSSQFSRGGN
ncbi:MAG: guanosine monophosphate reductase [Nanoarchaeota archaeon]|nr:guanosine monophosphate reductase [Nanoarchaeota archaeon]